MTKRGAKLIALAAVISLLFCSCASRQHTATPEDTERIRELADALGDDLQSKILPKRERPDELAAYDYVISGKDYSYGTDVLAMFFGDYQAKTDCEVTVIFAGGSFVVARMAFIGGMGYYLRYEYDKQNPTSFEIKGQTITDISLKYQESPPKWTLTLNNGSSQRASFRFVDPQ